MADSALVIGLSVGIPLAVGAALIPGFFLLRRYLRGPTKGSDTNTRLDGKVIVVTGANTGIGKEAAKELYRRGARVLVLCRSRERAEAAIADIEGCDGKGGLPGSLEFVRLDLASLQSVRECAEEVKKATDKIDMLINNAGLYMKDTSSKTQDGFNMTFGVNHLGPFLLTELLTPLLLEAAKNGSGPKPKIINVSSIAHETFPMDFEQLDFSGSFGKKEAWRAYSVSKLANVLHAKELSERLQSRVNTYALHPGVVATEVFRDLPSFLKCFFACIRPLLKTPFHGAQTTLFCALDPSTDEESGLYYADCKAKRPHSRADIVQDRKRLWEYSRKAVGLGEEV